MISRLLALPLLFVAGAALAAEPAKNAALESLDSHWRAQVTASSDLLKDINSIITEYQALSIANQGAEAQKATLVEWLREAQAERDWWKSYSGK